MRTRPGLGANVHRPLDGRSESSDAPVMAVQTAAPLLRHRGRGAAQGAAAFTAGSCHPRVTKHVAKHVKSGTKQRWFSSRKLKGV